MFEIDEAYANTMLQRMIPTLWNAGPPFVLYLCDQKITVKRRLENVETPDSSAQSAPPRRRTRRKLFEACDISMGSNQASSTDGKIKVWVLCYVSGISKSYGDSFILAQVHINAKEFEMRGSSAVWTL